MFDVRIVLRDWLRFVHFLGVCRCVWGGFGCCGCSFLGGLVGGQLFGVFWLYFGFMCWVGWFLGLCGFCCVV